RRGAGAGLGTIAEPMTEPKGDPAPAIALPLRDQMRAAIARAWDKGTGSGALPPDPGRGAGGIEVARPSNAEHGDFSTNLALRLAKPLAMAPAAIAHVLAGALNAERDANPASPVASASVAGPGFVNLRATDR